jgi:hypothetical protein
VRHKRSVILVLSSRSRVSCEISDLVVIVLAPQELCRASDIPLMPLRADFRGSRSTQKVLDTHISVKVKCKLAHMRIGELAVRTGVSRHFGNLKRGRGFGWYHSRSTPEPARGA